MAHAEADANRSIHANRYRTATIDSIHGHKIINEDGMAQRVVADFAQCPTVKAAPALV